VPPEISRHKHIVTVVTDADSARLEHMAEVQGKSISALVYEILTGFLEQQPG
jgi:hypothetical protein